MQQLYLVNQLTSLTKLLGLVPYFFYFFSWGEGQFLFIAVKEKAKMPTFYRRSIFCLVLKSLFVLKCDLSKKLLFLFV